MGECEEKIYIVYVLCSAVKTKSNPKLYRKYMCDTVEKGNTQIGMKSKM